MSPNLENTLPLLLACGASTLEVSLAAPAAVIEAPAVDRREADEILLGMFLPTRSSGKSVSPGCPLNGILL